jgi:hypothetical protein
MKKMVFIISILLIFSCKENIEIFKGDIVFVEVPASVDTLYGNELKLDGIYTGSVCVYDSLILFSSHKYPDYSIYVFNTKTGKQISSVVRKGDGADEFVTSGFSEQFQIDSRVCLWIYDWSRKKCVLVDLIDNSQREKIDISGLKTERDMPFGRIFILNDSLLLTFNQGEDSFSEEKHLTPPLYRIFNYRTNKKITEYEAYNSFKYNEQMPPQSCLFSLDRIKPDRTKLVMAMLYLHQINIMDIETGKINGYRFKNTPDFDILRDGSHFEGKLYYYYVCVDDDLIYGVIQNEKDTMVDVFDWHGNLIKRLILDKKMESVALDPVNKYLYILTIGEDDEEIYRYDVSYLYK